MKVTVINGTEKHGVTNRLKEIFLSELQEKADITEYYLPKDCPGFCVGCTSCFLKGEQACKDADQIGRIETSLLKADLILMTSPAYVFHATGAMKAFLDHLGYRWMPHRPAPEMFKKRAVIITQCLGAGAGSAARDIKHSLSWWGISDIKVFAGRLMGGIVWEELPPKKQAALAGKIRKLSRRAGRINGAKAPRAGIVTKIKFSVCRLMQKSLHKANPEYLDGRYWAEQGWLGSARPWK